MRIIAASEKGINNIVDETLAKMPLNQRYDRIKGQLDDHGYGEYKRETLPYKIRIISALGSYSQNLVMPDNQTVSRTIDLIGQYDDVPDFLIASNDAERKKIINRPKNKEWSLQNGDAGKIHYYYQVQLTVLDDGVYIRTLGHQDELSASNICAIPIHSYDKENVTFNQSIWEKNVEMMTDYFLNLGTKRYDYPQNNKIILGSEKCLNKVLDVFKKQGLNSVTEKTIEGD